MKAIDLSTVDPFEMKVEDFTNIFNYGAPQQLPEIARDMLNNLYMNLMLGWKWKFSGKKDDADTLIKLMTKVLGTKPRVKKTWETMGYWGYTHDGTTFLIRVRQEGTSLEMPPRVSMKTINGILDELFKTFFPPEMIKYVYMPVNACYSMFKEYMKNVEKDENK